MSARKQERLLRNVAEHGGGEYATADLAAAFKYAGAQVEQAPGSLRVSFQDISAPFTAVGQKIRFNSTSGLCVIAKQWADSHPPTPAN